MGLDKTSMWQKLVEPTSLMAPIVNMAVKPFVIKAAKLEHMQPKLRPNAKRIKMKYGPFKIRGTKSNVRCSNL
jgi:hypothetical protein